MCKACSHVVALVDKPGILCREICQEVFDMKHAKLMDPVSVVSVFYSLSFVHLVSHIPHQMSHAAEALQTKEGGLLTRYCLKHSTAGSTRY